MYVFTSTSSTFANWLVNFVFLLFLLLTGKLRCFVCFMSIYCVRVLFFLLWQPVAPTRC